MSKTVQHLTENLNFMLELLILLQEHRDKIEAVSKIEGKIDEWEYLFHAQLKDYETSTPYKDRDSVVLKEMFIESLLETYNRYC